MKIFYNKNYKVYIFKLYSIKENFYKDLDIIK